MTTRKQLYLFLSSVLISSMLTHARASSFEFQNIRVGGTGCPSDITQIVTSPDLTSASLLFQSFESHVPTAPNPKGGTTNISLLNCNLFLDIRLAPGQKLDSLEISYDMRGHTFLNEGVAGSFKSYLISANGLGAERTQRNILLQEKKWLNTSIDQEEDFLLQTTKVIALNSECGNGPNADRVALHLQHQLGTQILMNSQGPLAEGTITMDSSDLKGGIRLRALTSRCVRNPSTEGPRRGERRNCRVIRLDNRPTMVCQ
jgi:hypothetical protein